MPRILVDSMWYDPVSSASLYEADYEAAILQHAPNLFPGFHCTRFKALVESEYGNGRPDLALIDHQYRAWYVVEVELDTHPLESHVEEQVRKFAFGAYGRAHVEALCSALPSLDRHRVAAMLLGDTPSVLVLVTSHKPDWSTRLAQYNAGVGVIEVFRDDLDNTVLRVNGDQPTAIDTDLLTECSVEPLLRKALKLHSPAPLDGLDEVDLLFEGSSTRWQVIRVQDAAWLMPRGRSALPIDARSKWTIHRIAGDLVLSTGGTLS